MLRFLSGGESETSKLEDDMSFMGFVLFIVIIAILSGIVGVFVWRTLRKCCLSAEYNRMAKYEEEGMWGDVELGTIHEIEITEEEQQEIDEYAFILPQAY